MEERILQILKENAGSKMGSGAEQAGGEDDVMLHHGGLRILVGEDCDPQFLSSSAITGISLQGGTIAGAGDEGAPSGQPLSTPWGSSEGSSSSSSSSEESEEELETEEMGDHAVSRSTFLNGAGREGVAEATSVEGGGKAPTEKLKKIVAYTKNLQSVASPERLAELMTELGGLEWDVFMGTETWRGEQEEWLTLPGEHLFLGAGGRKGRGVAIVLNERWRAAVKGRRAINERLAWLDVNMHGKKLRFVVAYFPHHGYADAEVDKLYTEINKICQAARRKGRKVILGGDFNAVAGEARQEDPAEAMGQFGLGERIPGKALIRWALEDKFALTNTS